MYSSAPAISSLPPFGTTPVMPTDMPGFVPHVTMGSMVSASMMTSLSKTASSSDFQLRHSTLFRSRSSSFSNLMRFERYSIVVSSGAIMPARAPASMDMLQMVMRASMLNALIALPRYSSV